MMTFQDLCIYEFVSKHYFVSEKYIRCIYNVNKTILH